MRYIIFEVLVEYVECPMNWDYDFGVLKMKMGTKMVAVRKSLPSPGGITFTCDDGILNLFFM